MPTFADILGLLTLASDFVIILFVIDSILVHLKIKRKMMYFWKTLGDQAMIFALVVALVSTLGSLYYSDILKYEPCKLCWIQRIFMYPQVILFAVALWKKDRAFVWWQSRALSSLGAIVALFHYYIQTATKPIINIPCSALGYSASCAQNFGTSFGYITIPMMALTGFILLLILGLIHSKENVL